MNLRNKNTLLLIFALAVAACSRVPGDHASAPTQAAPAPLATSQPQPSATSTPRATPHALARDPINDSVITARIKAGILSDPGMAGSDVSVNTDHGVVSLTGSIKSQEQAAIASAHAQKPDGVMRVDNQLAVNMH